MGGIQKWRHRGRGREVPKNSDKSDIGGSGVHADSDITTKKSYV